MMFRQATLILSALVVGNVTTPSALSQQAFFRGLGSLPGGTILSDPEDISADGTVIVGSGRNNNVAPGYLEVLRWTRETGMIGLGVSDNAAQRVSTDGSTIVTYGSHACQIALCGAYRWTNSAGLVPLPINPLGVSGDGSILAGQFINATTGLDHAVRWTEAGGVEFLPVHGDFPSTFATDISADGSIVLGVGRGNDLDPTGLPWSLFVWSAADGVDWLDLPSPVWTGSDYLKISDNGKVVTGSMGESLSVRRGFRWTRENGAVEIDRLPDGLWMSANAASSDGSIIVGNSQNVSPPRPSIWDAAHGARYLDDVLVNELGLGDSLAGWTQIFAKAVSGDGQTVVGRGINPAGNREGWVAFLGAPVPEPSTLALIAAPLALLSVRTRSVHGIMSRRRRPQTATNRGRPR
jgi:uncharacterized membrane protein